MAITSNQINRKLYSSKAVENLIKFEIKKTAFVGVNSIDRDFGFPTGYYVILGNPGTGKSWFSLWIARMFHKYSNINSVCFTLEMPEPIVRTRILQQWSDLTKQEIENGGLTDKALDLMTKDVIVVDDFYSDDTVYQTPEMFEAWIDEYYNLGYLSFHFDHLHELDGASDDRNKNITEKWARTFQGICKKYPDIWLFVYAQPNGEAAKKKILRRTDIYGSKAITQKCDYFLSLNRSLEIDESTGVPIYNDEQREIILFLDKTRYTEKAHIGFSLDFLKTGNFK